MRTLFPELMPPADWPALATPVQAMHGGHRSIQAHGRADVEGDLTLRARLLRRLLSLPEPGADQPISVRIERNTGIETWTREFRRGRMRSILARGDGDELHERLGPMTLRFRLRRNGDSIEWQLVGARFLGLPLPRALLGQVTSRSGAANGRYRFDIDARPPMFGRLIAYRGWLEIVDDA